MNESFNIDLENSILGRICSFIAKKLLQGHSVKVTNEEKVIIRGSEVSIVERYRNKYNSGTQRKGPFLTRTPRGLFERAFSRMIPKHKRASCLRRFAFGGEGPFFKDTSFYSFPHEGVTLFEISKKIK